ncbi:DUF4870 domain-containing protein [Lederbergia lenta]|uniref:Uncharacterized protein conserved in bacteria n=1 Tax=Lederbergia lenta TaxID=1467 RepID=A0A2X4WDS6_LEDLE|nr:DUF4870 domain-containing protein [Lederbergia lenta]MCM3109362.1 DUF4870 domain-containing protein [Lederbergia lenta]MEC2324872.1 DUF4870 domain-containing protein [Lederbergia lenta]SQI57002.1 Uncharacterized protein conserved in bacteria [Lederbergia lenta]
MENSTERTLATVIYVSSFFTAVIGPLIIWLIKKDESSFIDYHGREYLNFLISYTVYGIVAAISMIVLIGFILLPIVGLLGFIFTIIGAIKAYEGQAYRIPFIFRVL